MHTGRRRFPTLGNWFLDIPWALVIASLVTPSILRATIHYVQALARAHLFILAEDRKLALTPALSPWERERVGHVRTMREQRPRSPTPRTGSNGRDGRGRLRVPSPGGRGPGCTAIETR